MALHFRYILCTSLHWVISEGRFAYHYVKRTTTRGKESISFTIINFLYQINNLLDSLFSLFDRIMILFQVLTKDSVTVSVDAVVYYRVSNATVSVANVENAHHSTRLLAQTTLRNILGTKNLHEILSDRESISGSMQVCWTYDIITCLEFRKRNT